MFRLEDILVIVSIIIVSFIILGWTYENYKNNH